MRNQLRASLVHHYCHTKQTNDQRIFLDRNETKCKQAPTLMTFGHLSRALSGIRVRVTQPRQQSLGQRGELGHGQLCTTRVNSGYCVNIIPRT